MNVTENHINIFHRNQAEPIPNSSSLELDFNNAPPPLGGEVGVKKDNNLNQIQFKYFTSANFTKACEHIAGVPSRALEGRVLSFCFINFMTDSPVMGSHALHLLTSISFFALTRHSFALPPTLPVFQITVSLSFVSQLREAFSDLLCVSFPSLCHVTLFLSLFSSHFSLKLFCVLIYCLASPVKYGLQESRNFARNAYSYTT